MSHRSGCQCHTKFPPKILSLRALQAPKIPNIVIFGAPVANHANVATYHTQGLVATIQRAAVPTGHPKRIHNELGVHREVFDELIRSLHDGGQGPSRYIHLSWREACHISLHMCDRFIPPSCRRALSAHIRDNIKVCHFFHSLNWITNLSRYFQEMLLFFSSPPFYPDIVHLPTANTPLSSKIQDIQNSSHFFKTQLVPLAEPIST